MVKFKTLKSNQWVGASFTFLNVKEKKFSLKLHNFDIYYGINLRFVYSQYKIYYVHSQLDQSHTSCLTVLDASVDEYRYSP
jgi:hypothetical protein